MTAGHLPTLWDVRCEKTQCEMVPIKKVCRSSYEYVLDILLVETVPTRFCWLTCRKQKLVDSKTLQERLFACCQDFDSLGRFLSILNVYLTDMQINRWLHLSRSLWGNRFRRDIFRRKNRHEKWSFIATNNWILAVRRSLEYIFSLQIHRYSGKVVEKKRRRGNTRISHLSSSPHITCFLAVAA